MKKQILRRKTVVVWHNTYIFKQNVCFTAYYKQVIKCIVEQLPKNFIIFINSFVICDICSKCKVSKQINKYIKITIKIYIQGILKMSLYFT